MTTRVPVKFIFDDTNIKIPNLDIPSMELHL